MSGRIPVTGRTVIVGRGSLDFAYRTLNTIMNNMGITKKLQRRRYYEKPTKKREREEYEKCLRLYNREMKKKVEFVMRQHKPLPPV